jgi:hypothetical protein
MFFCDQSRLFFFSKRKEKNVSPKSVKIKIKSIGCVTSLPTLIVKLFRIIPRVYYPYIT